jgi:uncharacterized membrane protein
MADREHKIIMNVYAALTVSLLMSFIPAYSASILALVMFTCVFISTYVIRSKADHDSLVADHMTFIIRTLWITGLFGMFTLTAASFYLLSVYDPSSLLSCAQALPSTTDIAALEAAIKPCMSQFMSDNMTYFIKSTIIAASPLVIYLGYRLTKGLSRAIKRHRIGDNKTWF